MVFQQELRFLETAREKTLALVSGLSQAQMDFVPDRGKWSIGEIVDHLLLSEKMYRDQYVELIGLARAGQKAAVYRSTRDINFSPFFIPKSMLPLVELPFTVLTTFVPRALREFTIRYPFIPGQFPDAARPVKGRPAATLRRELVFSIQQTRALFESNPDLDYEKMTIRQPLLGRNSVLGLLRITASHEERHHGQITDVRNDRRFPRAA